ncbi:LTXXQ motif family protein [Oryzisolibacter propanilivorax]|uniref:LTXXQ motif family protein n=1 Tax=Oryzisolibacter propanilivorax TaxID=1527607 RepID=A0A1G9QJF7_9BURK|nr:Spy/CpxP family protein refolding chaperone [Oryzisolibacter propanilivorax]SDM11126.1 LTXXQ motif family protein [Oryzisolibacter propanilivorax]
MTRTRTLLSSAACAALLAFSGTAALAQPAPAASVSAAETAAPAPHHAGHARRAALTPEQRQHQREQFRQARERHIAEFKQKLSLSADQEPAWNTLTEALKPGQRHARLGGGSPQDWRQLSTPERLDRMRALRVQRAAEFDRRADAVKAFYATLRPEQQKTFDAEGQRLMARFAGGPHGHRHGMQGHAQRHHAKHAGGPRHPGQALAQPQ